VASSAGARFDTLLADGSIDQAITLLRTAEGDAGKKKGLTHSFPDVTLLFSPYLSGTCFVPSRSE
jgi:hypothetical protein